MHESTSMHSAHTHTHTHTHAMWTQFVIIKFIVVDSFTQFYNVHCVATMLQATKRLYSKTSIDWILSVACLAYWHRIINKSIHKYINPLVHLQKRSINSPYNVCLFSVNPHFLRFQYILNIFSCSFCLQTIHHGNDSIATRSHLYTIQLSLIKFQHVCECGFT